MHMTKMLMAGGLIAISCLSAGCENMSNTAKGGLIGGGTGAGLGALAGGGKGALIGGLAGGLIGGAVGNDMDQHEKRQLETRVAVAESQPRRPPLGVFDVIQLSREGMNEDVLVNQIRSTGSTFQLSTEDVRALQQNGVSSRVIIEMQNRPPVARRIIYREPPPIYYAPPPPVGVGVIIR